MDSRFEIEALATHSSQLRVCRTIDCDRDAQDQDDLCMQCREDIDAVRAAAGSVRHLGHDGLIEPRQPAVS